MRFEACLLGLLVSRAVSIAIPQAEAIDPLGDAIAANEDAAAESEGPPISVAQAAAEAVHDAIAGDLAKRAGTTAAPVNFTGPEFYDTKTINAPKDSNFYMGVQAFSDRVEYNPQICATACQAKSAYNIKQAAKTGKEPRICRFFNAYWLLKNGTDPLFTCAYYTQPHAPSYAKNSGQFRGNTRYSHSESNGYTLSQTGTVPDVVLDAPIAITPVDSDGNAEESWDDDDFPLEIPFPLTLYGKTSSKLTVSVNGWVNLLDNLGTGQYVNTPLPAADLSFPVFVPYWSDLYITMGTPQGIYYQIQGATGARTLTIEWYTSLYHNAQGYFHFAAKFFEASPGKVVYSYYQANDQYASTNTVFGTVGVQDWRDSADASKSNQWSFDVRPQNGLQIEYDPATDTFSRTSSSVPP